LSIRSTATAGAMGLRPARFSNRLADFPVWACRAPKARLSKAQTGKSGCFWLHIYYLIFIKKKCKLYQQ
jgi:hypothetical protein